MTARASLVSGGAAANDITAHQRPQLVWRADADSRSISWDDKYVLKKQIQIILFYFMKNTTTNIIDLDCGLEYPRTNVIRSGMSCGGYPDQSEAAARYTRLLRHKR